MSDYYFGLFSEAIQEAKRSLEKIAEPDRSGTAFSVHLGIISGFIARLTEHTELLRLELAEEKFRKDSSNAR